MVYIPFDVFTRYFRIDALRNNKEVKKGDTFIAWVRLLEYCPTKMSEWERLRKEWGKDLDYNWTLWTPKGRVPAPKIKRRWLSDVRESNIL